jgi:hypothetical protein
VGRRPAWTSAAVMLAQDACMSVWHNSTTGRLPGLVLSAPISCIAVLAAAVLTVYACYACRVTDRAREAKAAASLQELGTPLLEVFLAQGEEGQLRSQPVSLRPPSTGDDSKGTARCVVGLRVLLCDPLCDRDPYITAGAA